MTLSIIERASDDGHRAIRIKADAAHLLAWRRRDLEKAANPEPAQFPALATLPLLRANPLASAISSACLSTAGKSPLS